MAARPSQPTAPPTATRPTGPPAPDRPRLRPRRPASRSSGTSGPPTTSCSACPARPAPPTTCRPTTARWLTRPRRRCRRRPDEARRDRSSSELVHPRRRPCWSSGPTSGRRRRSSSSSRRPTAQSCWRPILVRPSSRSRVDALVSGRSTGDRAPSPTLREALPDWKSDGLCAPRGPDRGTRPNRRPCSRPGRAVRGDRAADRRDHRSRLRRARRRPRRRSRRTDLIETTTGGIRWLPEPGIRRVILGPVVLLAAVQLPDVGPRLAVLRLSRSPTARWTRRQPRAAAVGRPAPPRARRRDPAADPQAPRLARPLPHRDRPAARPVEADHQAPPRPTPRGRPGDDHRGRARSCTTASAAIASTTPRRDQAVPHRIAGQIPPVGPRWSRGPSSAARVR